MALDFLLSPHQYNSGLRLRDNKVLYLIWLDLILSHSVCGWHPYNILHVPIRILAPGWLLMCFAPCPVPGIYAVKLVSSVWGVCILQPLYALPDIYQPMLSQHWHTYTVGTHCLLDALEFTGSKTELGMLQWKPRAQQVQQRKERHLSLLDVKTFLVDSCSANCDSCWQELWLKRSYGRQWDSYLAMPCLVCRLRPSLLVEYSVFQDLCMQFFISF